MKDVAEASRSTETSVSSEANYYYQFRFEPFHVDKGKRSQTVFVCDICRGVFKRSFSLKRHYLRFHINFALLSPRDLNNCAIVVANHRPAPNTNVSEVKKKSLVYRCHQCGYLLASKDELLSHLEAHDKKPDGDHPESLANGANRCPRCSTAFSMKKTLRRHLKKNRCRDADADAPSSSVHVINS